MDNHYADQSDIVPSLPTLFNIVAARFKSFAHKSAGGKPGNYLAQHPRVIIACLSSKNNIG